VKPTDVEDQAPERSASRTRDGGSPDSYIGSRLRQERERRGLSLRKLAGELGISPSALSQIETGRSRPSVGTLYSIVSELGLSFDELFAAEPRGRTAKAVGGAAEPKGRAAETGETTLGQVEIVTRADERRVIELESGVTWERLNPIGERDVEFLEVIYDVGGASSRDNTFVHHAGREYGLVLSGTLRVTVGYEAYVLAPGDSICFDSAVPHRLETVGDEPAKAIWFVIGRAGSDARAQWSPGDASGPSS
jgi:transcriptional regulator with XRE-family HTH domain